MPKVFDTDDYGLVDRALAREVALVFLRHPMVKRVELFGSVARQGMGEDLDLILVADDEHASDFIAEVQRQQMKILPCSGYHTTSSCRLDALRRIFGPAFAEYLGTAERLTSGTLDIFVFPAGWRSELARLQEDFEHDDPFFMQNVAGDAIIIAP